MIIVTIAWIYVVLMMALAEALSSQGTVLGAIVTFVLYGLLPLSIVLYVMGSPMRRKARRAADAAVAPEAEVSGATPPDGSNLPAGDAVATERKEA